MMLGTLMAYARPYRQRLGIAGLLGLGEATAILALPWCAGQIANSALSGSGVGIGALISALLAILALHALLRFANRSISAAVAADIVADLRLKVFTHLQALPLSFHHRQRHGETLALLAHDIGSLSSFIAGPLVQVVPLFLTAAGAIAIMLHQDTALSLLVGGLVPIFYLILRVAGRHLRELAQATRASEARVVAAADEGLRTLEVIKSFTCEEQMAVEYRSHVQKAAERSKRQSRLSAAMSPLVELVTGVAAVLLLAWSGMHLTTSERSAAEIVGFMLYAVVLTRPISRMAGLYGQVQSCRGALARLGSVLAQSPETRVTGRALRLPVQGAISFQNVSFAYPGRPNVITNFNLNIAAGETIALTGPNGAGKSTLVHLLMRFVPPISGRILVDGQDLAHLDLRSLRQHVGYVPQHLTLLNRSIRDNIALTGSYNKMEMITEAARLAQIHDLIIDLPEGYDTVIGDNGIRLSGGQRQKIALARALIRNPPILILDEATAMFDPESERKFIKDVRETLCNRTVILITHRSATLDLADRVIPIGGCGASQDQAAA